MNGYWRNSAQSFGSQKKNQNEFVNAQYSLIPSRTLSAIISLFNVSLNSQLRR